MGGKVAGVGACGSAGDAFAGASAGWPAESIGSGSGRRSRGACRARTRRRRPACRARSASGGFGRVAACRPVTLGRAVGAVPVASLSARRSRCLRAEWLRGARDRPPARSVARRRSRGSCGATPRRAAAALTYRATTAQWHADRARAAARSPPSSPSTTSCAATCRTVSRARCSVPAASPWAVPTSCGSAGVAVAARTAAGRGLGARSRFPTGCAVDFPDDESMRVSHEAIYQSLYRAGPRSAASRELTACLRTGRALRVPQGPRPRSRQGLRHRRGPDQPAARRGRRPGRPGPLGRRPHPRPAQLGDRHARRAQQPVHDAAAPAADGRPRRPESQERARR